MAAVIADGTGAHEHAHAPVLVAGPAPVVRLAPAPLVRDGPAPLRPLAPLPLVRGPVVVGPGPIAVPAPILAPAPVAVVREEAIAVPAPVPVAIPAPAYRPAPAYAEPEPIAPPAYEFGYGVQGEPINGAAQYAHNENRNGYNTAGEYRVALPDGRTQVVSYRVNDADSGYIADVRYEGVAIPYEAPKPAYGAIPLA